MGHLLLFELIFFFNHLNEQPGTDPPPQHDDRWGCFKWSVHVHVIDLEDSTTSHRGDEDGFHRSGEEGRVQQRCKNKWAPTQLWGLSHYCAAPTYWFIALLLNNTLAPQCDPLTRVEWVILEPSTQFWMLIWLNINQTKRVGSWKVCFTCKKNPLSRQLGQQLPPISLV